jgi:hypothetical protein
VLHLYAVLIVEMALRVDRNNAIMETRLDVKLDVNLTLDIHVLVLLVNPQYALQISVEIQFLEMVNSVIMVTKLVALNVKSFLDIIVQVI